MITDKKINSKSSTILYYAPHNSSCPSCIQLLDELLIKIFSLLNSNQSNNLKLVHKTWYQIIIQQNKINLKLGKDHLVQLTNLANTLYRLVCKNQNVDLSTIDRIGNTKIQLTPQKIDFPKNVLSLLGKLNPRNLEESLSIKENMLHSISIELAKCTTEEIKDIDNHLIQANLTHFNAIFELYNCQNQIKSLLLDKDLLELINPVSKQQTDARFNGLDKSLSKREQILELLQKLALKNYKAELVYFSQLTKQKIYQELCYFKQLIDSKKIKSSLTVDSTQVLVGYLNNTIDHMIANFFIKLIDSYEHSFVLNFINVIDKEEKIRVAHALIINYAENGKQLEIDNLINYFYSSLPITKILPNDNNLIEKNLNQENKDGLYTTLIIHYANRKKYGLAISLVGKIISKLEKDFILAKLISILLRNNRYLEATQLELQISPDSYHKKYVKEYFEKYSKK